MAQTLGVISFVWRGQALDAEKGSKVKLGGYKQNGVVVQGKTHYAQEFEASEIDVTTPLQRGADPSAVFAGGVGELQCNCDTGQSFIFPDAFITNRPEMTANEGGKINIKFMASAPETLLNG